VLGLQFLKEIIMIRLYDEKRKIVYYYALKEHYEHAIKLYVELGYRMNLVTMADCVVDVNTNEFIKCRRSLVDLIEDGSTVVEHFKMPERVRA